MRSSARGVLLLLFAACFSPALDYDDGKLACSGGECPPGYQCFANRCWRHLPSPEVDAAAGAIDATDIGEPDAPPAGEPDAPLAAEPDAPLAEPDAALAPDAAPAEPDAAPDAAPAPPDAGEPDAAPPPPDAAPPPPDAAPPPHLTLSETTVSFGNVTVNGSATPVTVRVDNDGGSPTEALDVRITQDGTAFTLSNNLCAGGKVLAAGESCTLKVGFSPTSAGPQAGILRVGAGALLETVDLSGTGITPGTLNAPDSASFATTASGATSASVPVTLSNTGGSAITGLSLSIGGTDAGQFAVAGGNCGNATLNMGQSCTAMLTFSPSGAGDKAGSLMVSSTSGESTSVALSGTGTASLSVDFMGNGGGRVTSDPNGIDCTVDCSSVFSAPSVDLTPTPDATSNFSGWGNACSGSTGCSAAMTGNRTVTATFTKKQYTLMIAKGGTGSGTVTSDVGGISCGSTCMATVDTGTPVELTAAASGGSTFTNWTGGGCSTANPCTVTVSGPTTVTANFTAAYTLTINMTGIGSGSITDTPHGINCTSGTCTYNFAPGTSITLSHASGATSAFLEWGGGGCSDYHDNTCTFTMNANKTFDVKFVDGWTWSFTDLEGTGTIWSTDFKCNLSLNQMCTGKFPKSVNGAIFIFFDPPGYLSKVCTVGTRNCLTGWYGNDSTTVRFGYAGVEAQFTGAGSGKIKSTPVGVDCDKALGCTGQVVNVRMADVPTGMLTFTATATAGSTFMNWYADLYSPCVNGTTNPCTIPFTGYTQVGASFKTP